MIDEQKVSRIVRDVISKMDLSAINKPARKQLGVFDTMEEAIEAVNKAYVQFRQYNKAQRENIINEIRKLTHAEAETMAKLAVEDTGMGNVYWCYVKITDTLNLCFLVKSAKCTNWSHLFHGLLDNEPLMA